MKFRIRSTRNGIGIVTRNGRLVWYFELTFTVIKYVTLRTSEVRKAY
jgi:hypothetical protein